MQYFSNVLGQRGNPPRPTEVDLCWKAARRWQDLVGLQHPERVHSSSGPQTEGRNANLCQDSHWEDHHRGGGAERFHRECEGQDPGKKRFYSILGDESLIYFVQDKEGIPPDQQLLLLQQDLDPADWKKLFTLETMMKTMKFYMSETKKYVFADCDFQVRRGFTSF